MDRTKSIEHTPGPGYYKAKPSFGEGLNDMIIGEKREISIPCSKGPGDYHITKADRLVRTQHAGYSFRPQRSPNKE